MPGVYRTRVGYAGGKLENPTYHRLGDHTETLQIEYDPRVITFRDLLEIFWDSHSPTRPAYSTQYKAAVFYHNPEQEQAARESRERWQEKYQANIITEILPFTNFYRAEDYHQKYYLLNHRELAAEITSRYLDFQGFVDSTAAARLNGYIGGYGTKESLESELENLGLSEEGATWIRRFVK